MASFVARLPRTVSAIQVRTYAVKKIVPKGRGGRSSVNNVSATVFGATGFLGRYVVNRLARVGSQIVCPYRGCELEYRHLRPMGDLGQIHFNEFAITNEASINEQLVYSNVAINLIGQEYDSRHFKMHDVNVDGARTIARAAKENEIQKFIHVSALGANVDSPSTYLRTKALGEIAVREEFPEAVIVRCSNIIGNEDRFLNRLANLAYNVPGPFPLTNFGTAKKMPVTVSDVSNGINEIVYTPEADGKTYEFVGPKTLTMEQLMSYIGDTVRRPVWTVGLPEEAAPFLKFAFSLGGIARLESLPNEEEFFRYSLDDVVTKGLPGLRDLGVEQSKLEATGITVLRKYRDHIYHDDAVDA